MRTTPLAAISLMALVAVAVPGAAAAQSAASRSQRSAVQQQRATPAETARNNPPEWLQTTTYRHLLWVFYARRGCIPLAARMDCDRADDLVLMYSEVPRLGSWDIETFHNWVRRAPSGRVETLRSLPGTVISIKRP